MLAAVAMVAIVVPPGEAGAEFAAHLASELDEPATVHTSTITFGELLSLPPLPWREHHLVFADPQEGRILVMRPKDRTLLLRAIDPAAAQASSYALAIAAAELLRAARASEEAIVPPPRSPPPQPGLALGASVALGAALTEAFGHEPVLVQGALALDLELLDEASGLFSTVGVAFRAPSTIEKNLADGVLRYRRWDPALQLGIGSFSGDFDVSATLEVGASIARAEVFEASGERIARDDRVPIHFALGGRARYHFVAGLGIELDASLIWSASPADYVVRDQVVLSEGRFRWQVGASGVWRWR